MAALVAPRGAVAACSSAVRTTGVPRARAALPRLPLPRSAPASRVCGSGPVGTSGSRGSVAANAASDFSAASLGNTAVLRNGFVDYYTLLQVDDDASQAEIKSAYRSLAKACHPDYLGGKGHEICILLNEAYEVLSDPSERAAYNYQLEQAIIDTTDGYSGQPLSKWMVNTEMGKNEDPNESRGVFVDENTCIGCKMCVWCAPATFRMEDEYGRSRVFAQWSNTEDDIEAAINSCPVSCISWVDKEELPALEYVMQNEVKRVNVGVMMAGQGGGVEDVFQATQKFLKQRAEREAKIEKARRYSPAQEAARQAAVDEMMNQNLGFFASAMKGFMGMRERVLAGGAYTAEDGERVGRRKRSKRWDEEEAREQGLLNGATIPPERALVTVMVDDK
mmetsp:Transcript_32885/g.84020  ORF Transcript_32885/g.84020 Transcript_32885/m.84020 type:complete len:392 (-) Transcript_32885:319-1494(-)|eukprot:jgi/Tetstr1/423202/TSEL_001322.t1